MNNTVNIVKSKVLSDNWYTLRKVTFYFHHKNGEIKTQSREAYDRGNGADSQIDVIETKVTGCRMPDEKL